MSIELVRPSNHLILCHPLLLLPSIFPSIRVFSKSKLFASGGQSTGVSASASVLPMNTQDWSLGWTGWISLQSKGLSRVFSNTTVQKHQFFQFTFKKSLWLQCGEWTQGQRAVEDEVIQTRVVANRMAKSAHREIWPPEVDFGEMLAPKTETGMWLRTRTLESDCVASNPGSKLGGEPGFGASVSSSV